jgi:hypothetical protein
MVVYTCNPSYMRGIVGGSWFKASLGKKQDLLLWQRQVQDLKFKLQYHHHHQMIYMEASKLPLS